MILFLHYYYMADMFGGGLKDLVVVNKDLGSHWLFPVSQ